LTKPTTVTGIIIGNAVGAIPTVAGATVSSLATAIRLRCIARWKAVIQHDDSDEGENIGTTEAYEKRMSDPAEGR